ncbi:MAG: N-6 DNA methylase [Actinomycetota bacterium]
MASVEVELARRRALGAWYTPHGLVEELVERTIESTWLAAHHGPIRVLDPACGDGRFLVAAAGRLAAIGANAELYGVDIDPEAVAAARTAVPAATIIHADALDRPWPVASFDVVLGNPPFLSPLVAASGRDAGRRRAVGGPYTDAAAEFLLLAVDVAAPGHGRVGFVLPQSLLAARDATDVRTRVDALGAMCWSRTTDEHDFGATVATCAVIFERRDADDAQASTRGTAPTDRAATTTHWARIAADGRGVPPLADVAADGSLGDRARATVGFRDEFYALAAAVGDDVDGPPLVTSGMIDPGRCAWGETPARIAKRTFVRPRIELDALEPRFRRWVDDRIGPKVLVANQTAIVEAVADPDGEFVPGVPVIAVLPADSGASAVWELAAVLSSPIASQWIWRQHGGTGMSARVVRLSPALIESVPWPRGDLASAVAAVRAGEVAECGARVLEAYGEMGTTEGAAGFTWWSDVCARVQRRAASRRPVPDGA